MVLSSAGQSLMLSVAKGSIESLLTGVTNAQFVPAETSKQQVRLKRTISFMRMPRRGFHFAAIHALRSII
jgi:hypothetical protein